MRHLWLSVTAILAIFFVAHARAQIVIPEAVAAGTGCPEGTALIGVSPDLKKIVALFDEYSVVLPRGTGKGPVRKSCTLAIPVSVPKNTQIVIKEISIENDLNLPKGAKSVFEAEVFFAGGRSPKSVDAVKGAVNKVRVAKKAIKVVSACGKDAILRVNTSLLVQSESGGPALSGIRDKLELKLATQRCRP